MSAFRDALAPDQRDTYDAGIARFGAGFAAARRERDETAAQHGPEAVAERAAGPGEDPGGIATRYRALQAQARKASAA